MLTKLSFKDWVNPRNGTDTGNEKPVNITDSTEQKVIDSVDMMSAYLESLKETASPAMRNVIKTQLSVLSAVESPSLIGMAMDNMTECLKDALDNGSEQEKVEIRKFYSQMLQNSVFLAEAKLRYSVDRNKEEAVKLLEDAGKNLTETVSGICKLAANSNTNIVFKNILNSQTLQSNLFGRLGAFLGNKKRLEDKQCEFNKTLNNIFVTLDKYPEYYGKSIVINGMIAKYKEQLLDAFVDSQIQPVVNNMTAFQFASMSEILDELEKSLKKVSAIGAVASLIKTGSKVLINIAKKKTAETSLKSFCRQYDSYTNQLDEYRKRINEEEAELAELKTRRKDIGFFKLTDKRESKFRIEEQEEVLKKCKKDLQLAEEKFHQLNSLCPNATVIKTNIINYNSFLENLEAKYSL